MSFFFYFKYPNFLHNFKNHLLNFLSCELLPKDTPPHTHNILWVPSPAACVEIFHNLSRVQGPRLSALVVARFLCACCFQFSRPIALASHLLLNQLIKSSASRCWKAAGCRHPRKFSLSERRWWTPWRHSSSGGSCPSRAIIWKTTSSSGRRCKNTRCAYLSFCALIHLYSPMFARFTWGVTTNSLWLSNIDKQRLWI